MKIKIKLIIILILFSISKHSSGQLIKEKIGTSVVVVDGKIVLDSSITYKMSYDKQGRKVDEWDVFRCFDCSISDTFYTKFDTLGRDLFRYSARYKEQKLTSTIYYNKLGLDTLKISESENKKLETLTFNAIYKNDILESDSQICYYQGKYLLKLKRQYKILSKKNVIVSTSTKNNLKEIQITKFNKEHKIKFEKYIKRDLIKGDIETIKITYKYDNFGNLLVDQRVKNEIKQNKMNHYYKNNLEYLSLKKYFAPSNQNNNIESFSIITSYKYTYWD